MSPGHLTSSVLPWAACSSRRTPADYVLKASGTAEYLIGDRPLIDFRYVRTCLQKKIPIDVTLVPLASVVRAAAEHPIDVHKEDVRGFGLNGRTSVVLGWTEGRTWFRVAHAVSRGQTAHMRRTAGRP